MKKNHKMLITLLIFYIVLLVTLLVLILPSAVTVIRNDIFQYWDADTVILLMVTIICCLTALVLKLYNIYSRNSEKENSKDIKNIYMDAERSYLERQINEINKKLLSTDERWKEAYHLVISSQDKQSDKTGKISVASFLRGFGIDIQNIEIQGDLAFILTPFHDDFVKIYNTVCEVCIETKLKPMRGDEEYVADDILKRSINYIVKSRLIITILDGRNPNVFYELGIAHALNKPTILLANVYTQIPFDLQNQFLILYEDKLDLKEKLKNALLNVLTLN